MAFPVSGNRRKLALLERKTAEPDVGVGNDLQSLTLMWQQSGKHMTAV